MGCVKTSVKCIKNVYARETVSLDPVMRVSMVSISAPVGLYLLQRSACELGLLGLTVEEMPNPESMNGPKRLVKKVASTKATTIRRATIKNIRVLLNKSQEKRTRGKNWSQMSSNNIRGRVQT